MSNWSQDVAATRFFRWSERQRIEDERGQRRKVIAERKSCKSSQVFIFEETIWEKCNIVIYIYFPLLINASILRILQIYMLFLCFVSKKLLNHHRLDFITQSCM